MAYVEAIKSSEPLSTMEKTKTVKPNIIRSKRETKTHFLLQNIGRVKHLGHSNSSHILSVRELLRITQRHVCMLDSVKSELSALTGSFSQGEEGYRNSFGFKETIFTIHKKYTNKAAFSLNWCICFFSPNKEVFGSRVEIFDTNMTQEFMKGHDNTI